MKGREATAFGANLTIQALVEVIMASFPNEDQLGMSPPTRDFVSCSIDRFLRDQLPFHELLAAVASSVGVTQPIERLRAILDTGPDPIPTPPTEPNPESSRRRSRTWTSYEDQRLLAGIYRHGIENWTSISKFVGNGRTRSQCSQRWYRGLNPKICREQWTKEEEQRLMYLVMKHGDQSWTNISCKLGNRSDVQCRYRYRQLQKEHERATCAVNGIQPTPPPARLPAGGAPPVVQPLTAPRCAEAEPQPEASEPQPAEGGGRYTISAPDFDARLYSVY
jgi:hypothetical protein